ncbi:M20 family metallopeptidase [Intrasporangium sp. DVR]|uniref:M20 metallopeptidase family protein n=1 Tax=Intrasporangium sp. DVR TaxID=3127867 RepID=UPI00313A6490
MSTRSLEIARSLTPDLVALRRRLHQVPEIGLELPRTQAVVLESLEGLGLEITTGQALSSVVAVLRGGAVPDGAPRPAVLLRADMDALPVTEEVEVDFRSTNGAMHACGHDLHVAALVGAASILVERRAELAGDVVLMFQPGEEGPGGAAPMIEEGLLEASGTPVSAAYTLHVFSAEHPLGTWFGRPGAQMAAADEMTVRVVGQGGHGSQPHRASDPIPAACEMVLALQTRVTRGFDVFDPVVVTVGRFAAGTKDNIIPDDAVFEGTVRTLSAAARTQAIADIERACRGIAHAHGLEVEITWASGAYPVTVNDEAEFELARDTVVDLFGPERWVEMANPELGSEDMAIVFEHVPGAYLNLSACATGDPELADDNHSPRASFDDSVLPDAAAYLAEMALRRLATL